MVPHQGGKGAGNRGLRRWSEVSEPSERSTGSAENLLKREILICRAREAWNEGKGISGGMRTQGWCCVFLSLYEDKNEWIFLISSLVNTLLGYVNSTIHMKQRRNVETHSAGRALISDWSGNSFVTVVFENIFGHHAFFGQKILTVLQKNSFIDNHSKSALPALPARFNSGR